MNSIHSTHTFGGVLHCKELLLPSGKCLLPFAGLSSAVTCFSAVGIPKDLLFIMAQVASFTSKFHFL